MDINPLKQQNYMLSGHLQVWMSKQAHLCIILQFCVALLTIRPHAVTHTGLGSS